AEVGPDARPGTSEWAVAPVRNAFVLRFGRQRSEQAGCGARAKVEVVKDVSGHCPRNAQSAVVLRFCVSVAALSALVTCISRKELLDGKQCAPAGTGPECAEGYSCYRPRNICLSPSQLALVADDDVSDSPDGGADDDDSESTAGAPGDDDVSVIAGGAVDTSMAGTSNAAGS